MLQPTDNVTIQGKSDIYKLCFLCSWMVNKKRKIPSKLSLMNCLSNFYSKDNRHINLSVLKGNKRGCGSTENRTLDFCLTDNSFTIKLLAHNTNHIIFNYLNFIRRGLR